MRCLDGGAHAVVESDGTLRAADAFQSFLIGNQSHRLAVQPAMACTRSAAQRSTFL